MKTTSSKNDFYIPTGMTVTGTFTSDAPGQIDGTIYGDVLVNGKLIISKTAVIIGNVEAEELEIWGRVSGYIQCSGKMILQKAAFIKGNIRTVEIHIEEDAVVDGIIFKPGHNKTEEEIETPVVKGPSIEARNKQVIPTEEPIMNKVAEDKAQSWF